MTLPTTDKPMITETMPSPGGTTLTEDEKKKAKKKKDED